MERIQTLKKKVQQKGDDMDDKEFDKIMGMNKQGRKMKSGAMMDKVREEV